MRIVFLSLITALIVISCKSKSSKKEGPDSPAVDSTAIMMAKRVKDSTLLSLTQTVLTAFKNKNYDSLKNFIHPDAGLRFSPYGFIDTASDVVIKSEKISQYLKTKKQAKITWGEFDGSGEPINMTLDEYMKTFVYDVDFIKPEAVKVDSFIGAGNSMNNLLEVYKDCNFTESHFSGFDKKFDGMDWRSLRLVYRQKDGKYYLVGVVHDQWTI